MRSVKVVFVIAALMVSGMLAAPRVHAEDAREKFAYVNLSRLFDEYEKTKAYDKVLEINPHEMQE